MFIYYIYNKANTEVPKICIPPTDQQGLQRLHWLQKEVCLYESQSENEPTSHLICELS